MNDCSQNDWDRTRTQLIEHLSDLIDFDCVSLVVNTIDKISSSISTKIKQQEFENAINTCIDDLCTTPSKKYSILLKFTKKLTNSCKWNFFTTQIEESDEVIEISSDEDEAVDEDSFQIYRPDSSLQSNGFVSIQSEYLIEYQKLNNLLIKIKKRIAQLDNSEMTLDDLNSQNSIYIYQSRLEKIAILIYKRLRLTVNRLRKIDPSFNETVFRIRQKFNCRLSRFKEIDKHVCSLVNSAKLDKQSECNFYFPDYHDVRHLITDLLENNNNVRNEADSILIKNGSIDYNQVDILTRQMFTRLGDILQSHRRMSFHQSLLSRLPEDFNYDSDPANTEDHLRQKLDDSSHQANSTLREIFEKYTYKQMERNGERYGIKNEFKQRLNTNRKRIKEQNSNEEECIIID